MSEPAQELVHRALAGDAPSVRALVDALSPVIQARVARALRRRAVGAGRRDSQQEVDDMTQEVFLSLFENQGRALRAWDPGRGLSLVNFAGFLAERQVASILRNGRRSPWKEDPTLSEDFDALDYPAVSAPGPEREVASREFLSTLLDRLREALTPKGFQLFELLMVDERPVEDVCRITGLQADAVYTWRSRLAKVVRKLTAEIESDKKKSAGQRSEIAMSTRISQAGK
ncbi:MAG: sigma-70 family RNA polymerase sigma factor [Deltaproteobacteria bacterium]|nr:sigma-70 family RNA polymerase sigma factor [Deltaproteobacteria bacterium]